MRYSIRTVTPANTIPLPFALEEAFKHLEAEERIGDEAEELLVTGQLRAAMDHVERYTSQILTPREMEISFDAFPCVPELIAIPREPVTAVTAIAYTDADGEPVTLDTADFRWSEAAADVVMPAFRGSWPTAADERGSVRVRFDAGYEEGLAPASLLAAVKLTLGHLYANREAVVTGTIATELPGGVRQLCAPYRRVSL